VTNHEAFWTAAILGWAGAPAPVQTG
jgi:hypothetical protein